MVVVFIQVGMFVSRDLAHITQLFLHAHGDAVPVDRKDVEWDGSHPVVHCALNSHACYSGLGKEGEFFVTLETHLEVLEIGDLIYARKARLPDDTHDLLS